MSLPANAVSPTAVIGVFLAPKDEAYQPLVSLHWGGTALNNPAAGRLVKIWTFFYSAGNVVASDGTPTVLFARTGVQTLAGAFDANMQPVVAFRDGTGCFVRYYDAVAAAYIFKQIPDADSVQCSVDDLRPAQTAASDVIVAYTKAGKLYWRQQRDRFDTEYLAGDAEGVITKCGMNSGYRFQFEVDPNVQP